MANMNKYTVQEAQNIQLGQCRSAYLDDTGAYTVAEGETIIAIQCVQDVKFTTLTADDPVNCYDSSVNGVGNSGGTGDDIQSATLFPAGLVLYGRWNAVTLASGVAVLYMGN